MDHSTKTKRKIIRIVLACTLVNVFYIRSYTYKTRTVFNSERHQNGSWNLTAQKGIQIEQNVKEKWIDGKDDETINSIIAAVHNLTCDSNRLSPDMKYLCSGHFVQTATQLLLKGEQVHIIQIGAHVGFEQNDPICGGLSMFLDNLVNATNASELRQNFHWTFVEPSPPNFRGLEKNIKSHAHICDMRSVNAAIVSDLAENPGHMAFYGILGTIDPISGFDSKSKKMLPFWLTQISSLNREQVFKPIFVNAFKKFGLDINDYVEETNVKTLSYSDLVNQVIFPINELNKREPLLVLVDTEGFDCNVVEGISPQSHFLPKYLVFEHMHCNATQTEKHLHEMGYTTYKFFEDTIAMHPDLQEFWPTIIT